MKMPSEIRKTDVYMEFFDMITEYNDSFDEDNAGDDSDAKEKPKSKEEKTELYYSPFCPFSRAVFLFIIEVSF